MTGLELAEFLQSEMINNQLYVSIPSLNLSFSENNSELLPGAIELITSATTLTVRQFTDFVSSQPYPNNPDRFLPVKRFAAVVVANQGFDQIITLSAEQTRLIYGSIKKDLLFVDADKLLKVIGHAVDTEKQGTYAPKRGFIH